MMRSTFSFGMLCTSGALAILAGCPVPGAGPQQPVPPAQPGAGCPTADNVHIASYLTQDEPRRVAGGGDPDGSAGGARVLPRGNDERAEPGSYTGWVLPLHALKVETIASQPEYARIDATTAGALGVPVAPTAVWLMTPGQAPCRATVGSYYGAAVDSTVPNVTYGVELSGCAAPPKEQQQDASVVALVSELPPSECQTVPPQPIAARLGEVDAQKHWQRPTKETPIPPVLAAAIPQRDCRPPGCEMLWSIAQVTVADRPVAWAGAVNWLTIPPGAAPASQCEWKAETFAGFFVAGPDGRVVKVTEGQDHSLLLTAVLADRGGPRHLLAEGAGEYAIYDLAAGAKLARHVVWLMLAPEAYAVDERIGPVCDERE